MLYQLSYSDLVTKYAINVLYNQICFKMRKLAENHQQILPQALDQYRLFFLWVIKNSDAKLTCVTLSSGTVSGFGGQLFRNDFLPKDIDSEADTEQAKTKKAMATLDFMVSFDCESDFESAWFHLYIRRFRQLCTR